MQRNNQYFEAIGTTIAYRQKAKGKPIGYRITSMSTEIADTVIHSVADLIDDPKYKPWFYKKLYTLGRDRFIGIADDVRRTHNIRVGRGRLFNDRLQNATKET